MNNIIINPLILQKAVDIIENAEIEKLKEKQTLQYIQVCVQAEICPICSEKLISRQPTKLDLCLSKFEYISHILDCNKQHFSYTIGQIHQHNGQY